MSVVSSTCGAKASQVSVRRDFDKRGFRLPVRGNDAILKEEAGDWAP